MTTSLSQNSKVVLILAPTSRDGEMAVHVLDKAGISARALPDHESLSNEMKLGCGAVIISEEALTVNAIACLQETLDAQETWSDLPILLLTSADVIRATEVFSKSGNISLLERPFSQLTLIRSAEVALRARSKQYEVRNLLHQLKTSKEDAEKANLAKSSFLANMSHELRTPIGAITGFIDLLRTSKNKPEEGLHYMEIIRRNSQQLLGLIDDILDLSKVEAGKMPIENIPFNLNEFLGEIITTFRFKAADKGLEFHSHLDTKIPQIITTDALRMRQVLSNILGNAIKFTERGSIDFSVAYEQGALSFRVKDSGIGLSEKQKAKLFQPFAQADSSTTRRFGGTGLGLVLSRRLAEALGGTLELAESSPGNGSTFEIQVRPEVDADTKMIDDKNFLIMPVPKVYMEDAAALKGLNVLLVEDSPDNQTLISLYLKKAGAKIDVKSNGAEGLKAAIETDYDLILMDVQMPLMDGHEATKSLRRLRYDKPIIALTAHAMSEERDRCLDSGFTDFLSKPIQRSHLLDVLSTYRPKNLPPQLHQ